MNGDLEGFAPFWNLWSFGGCPFIQLFDCSLAGIHDGKKFGENDFELWLFEIRVESCIELFGVLLDEKSELAELFLAVFEREGFLGIVGGSKSSVELEGGISLQILLRGIDRTYIVDVGES